MSNCIPNPCPDPKIKDVYPGYSRRVLDVMLDDYLAEGVQHLRKTNRVHYELSDTVTTLPLSYETIARIKGQESRKHVLVF